jgi:hypothetical protein
MPGVTVVQYAYGTYGALGALDKLPVPFASNNGIGNIGLAWVSSNEAGGIIGGITDSNSNTWEPFPGINLEDEFSQFWICSNLKFGANTVTANGCIPSSTGAPNLVILEIQPPPCPIGSTAIQGFEGDHSNDYLAPQLEIETNYSRSQGPFFHSLVVAIYNNTNSASNTARTWSMTAYVEAIAGGIVVQFQEHSGNNTCAIGIATVPYPYSQNSITYEYAPTTPTMQNQENLIIGALFGTQA